MVGRTVPQEHVSHCRRRPSAGPRAVHRRARIGRADKRCLEQRKRSCMERPGDPKWVNLRSNSLRAMWSGLPPQADVCPAVSARRRSHAAVPCGVPDGILAFVLLPSPRQDRRDTTPPVGWARAALASLEYGSPAIIAVCTAAITSPAVAPIIVKPRMRSSFSPTRAFMNPCLWSVACAPSTESMGSLATRAMTPWRSASPSLSPTRARGGSVNMQYGTSRSRVLRFPPLPARQPTILRPQALT
jgi:hypothetical protein